MHWIWFITMAVLIAIIFKQYYKIMKLKNDIIVLKNEVYQAKEDAQDAFLKLESYIDPIDNYDEADLIE